MRRVMVASVMIPMVFIAMVMMFAAVPIMAVVMPIRIGDRRHRLVEMRLRGKMRREIVDVEGEQQRGEKTAPPRCPVGRAARMA